MKCDNKSPCENCVKREHPQLCSYKPNRSSVAKSSVGSDQGHGKKRPHSPSGRDESRESGDLSDEAREAISTYGKLPLRCSHHLLCIVVSCLAHQCLVSARLEPDMAESSRYMGQNSIPAILKEQTASAPHEQSGVDNIRLDMQSILGLDNTAPFPLMSSRHLDRLTADISAELPADREVMKYVLMTRNQLYPADERTC